MIGEFSPQASLRGLYHLEDLVDSSGNAKTLVNTGSVTFTTGKFNNSANFGTSNLHSKYLSNTGFWATATPSLVTMMCWVKLNTEVSSGAFHYIIEGNTGTSGANFGIIYDYNAGARRLLGYLNLATTDAVPAYTVALGTTSWNHVAIVRINATTIELYYNGRLVGASAGTGADATLGAANLFMLGNSIGTGTSGLACNIDEAVVYEGKALSAKDISDYYNSIKQIYG